MIHYSPLTWQHIRDARDLGWGGWERWSDSRLRFLPMIGYAAHNDAGALIGVGGVVWVGRTAIACLALTPEFHAEPRSRWVHRQAVEVLCLAHRISEVVEAVVDPSIPRALAFMERLGFAPTDGEKWLHGVHDPSGASGRFVRDEQRAGYRADGGGGP